MFSFITWSPVFCEFHSFPVWPLAIWVTPSPDYLFTSLLHFLDWNITFSLTIDSFKQEIQNFNKLGNWYTCTHISFSGFSLKLEQNSFHGHAKQKIQPLDSSPTTLLPLSLLCPPNSHHRKHSLGPSTFWP